MPTTRYPALQDRCTRRDPRTGAWWDTPRWTREGDVMVWFLVLVAVAVVVIPIQVARARLNGKMDDHDPGVRRSAQDDPRDIDRGRIGF
ncbi:hypothetical protein OS128_06240 [Corynebacterium sp. P5848]|uniref:hypothetical protein n=1 Tax=Corynebacterium marambiense TaxID=2765364 RepID=UPI002260D356|nr:hypothetical protein [Corynebacterium marambiense]MCX7542511.1 hypothetical protein [Corynebacterium marambiense]